MFSSGSSGVATISDQGGVGTVHTVDLSGALAHINLAGRTQLRVRFTVDDTDENINNWVKFLSADGGDPVDHPKLIVGFE